ncbi:MAG: hypothetical protein ABEI52_01745, partial [Halobacteriaceae archaeon]
MKTAVRENMPSIDDFTLTTLSTEGRTGPTQTDANNGYSHSVFDVRVAEGVQRFRILHAGEYKITAVGAQGGTGSRQGEGGRGAKVSGVETLEVGDTLSVVVGQAGSGTTDMASGGGGTFVFKGTEMDASTLLLAAGGGGGYGVSDATSVQTRSLAHANKEESGSGGITSSMDDIDSNGGSGGNGGRPASEGGSGGAGVSSDGVGVGD